MGNLVIKIGKSGDSEGNGSENLEVYRDIALTSQKKVVMSIVKDCDGAVRRRQNKRFQEKDVNVRAVFNSIRNIFTWIPGERILNPEFGSNLRYYLYEGITPENKERIAAEVSGACLKWEPRINIESVTPINSPSDAEDNTVQVDIVFTIPSLSNKQYLYSYMYNRTL